MSFDPDSESDPESDLLQLWDTPQALATFTDIPHVPTKEFRVSVWLHKGGGAPQLRGPEPAAT
jgi:hypothetical protein